MRKKFESSFKVRVALEMLRGEKTIAQFGSKYAVHPDKISQRKPELIQRSTEIFRKPYFNCLCNKDNLLPW